MPMSDITTEYLSSHGYTLNTVTGYEKPLGNEHDAIIMVGYFPFNEFAVSIRIDGATIRTNVGLVSQLETLEQLLGDAFVDYDDAMYVDELDEALGGQEEP